MRELTPTIVPYTTYLGHTRCPKCEDDDWATVWSGPRTRVYAGEVEHSDYLKVTCRQCGYWYAMEPADRRSRGP